MSIFAGPKTRLIAFALLCCVLAATGVWIGLMMYSPDSWGYYELSKTVFGGDFYRFNTYRSYYSAPYSTSFPPGLPVVLALGQLIFGNSPLVAMGVNIAVSALTVLLIVRLSRQAGVSMLAAVTLAASVVLCEYYLDEVYAGRAIPLSLLFVLLSLTAWLSGRSFVSGLCLGFAALVRFDCLVYVVLIPIAFAVLKVRERRALLPLIAGCVLGLAPWIVYSEMHFGRFWVSDHSWIVWSASSAYVMDFPAAAAVTVREAPVQWLGRIAGNVLRLSGSIGYAMLRFPSLILLLLFFIPAIPALTCDARRRSLLMFVLLGASLAPYALTGNMDSRYFVPAFLFAFGIVVSAIEASTPSRRRNQVYRGTLIAGLAGAIVLGGIYFSQRLHWAMDSRHELDLYAQRVAGLSRCHEAAPDATYIFTGEAGHLGAQYGAMTGDRTALAPTNFDGMSGSERGRYFQSLKPFALISTVAPSGLCPLLYK